MADFELDHINKLIKWESGVSTEAVTAYSPRTLVLLNPAITTNPIPLGPIWFNIRIHDIQCFVEGITPSVTFKVYHGTDISGTGLEVVETGTTVTTSTITSVSTFDNPEIDAGEIMWAHITAKSGTVNSFCAFIHMRLRL